MYSYRKKIKEKYYDVKKYIRRFQYTLCCKLTKEGENSSRNHTTPTNVLIQKKKLVADINCRVVLIFLVPLLRNDKIFITCNHCKTC